MNNPDENYKEKLNLNIEQKEKKFQSNLKINRIHRITPTNNIKIKLFNTDKKSNEENQKKMKSAPHLSPSAKHKRKDIYEEFHKEEIEKEKQRRKNILNEFLLLYTEMKFNSFKEESNSEKYKDIVKNRETKYYYLINKTWFNQFKNYCKKKEISYSNINEDYPGQINNQHLILKDDTSLKLNSEKRIIINSKYLDNCTTINGNLWDFLQKIFGGGPELKFFPKINQEKDIQNNENELIIKAVHIYLLFIPKKEIISNNNNKEPSNNINNPLNPFQYQDIKKILLNNDTKSKYKIQDIYFDITKTVQELTNYINLILNQHRNKFKDTPIYFGLNYNSTKNNLINNINYRLWLNNIDADPNLILNYINEQINKHEDVDFPLKMFQMDKYDNLNKISFSPYLLSNFNGNKIQDIFPNKHTKNFDNHDFYDTKYEDDNSFPTITLLIEEFPYHFDEPKKKYLIKKCNFCGYRDYVCNGCICQKVFYCSDSCKNKDFQNHITSCKKGLFKYFSEQNEKLYRVIVARKEYYEKNKNEKENFSNVGLANLGNSCYMNSSLQCLFAIKELTNYFLYYFKDEYINKENILGTGGALAFGYINLLLTINNTTNNSYISPNEFKVTLGLCSKKYEGNDQEDAHEFLNYLLDMIHEDLNKVKNKTNNNIILNSSNKSDEEKSLIEWNNFLMRNQSLLVDLFYGQYKSCVICPQCNYKSINFNSFLSLELPINQNKNYNLFTICYIDHLKESPFVYFNVTLQKNEMKIFILRKKIANFLGIDILEFELALMNNNKMIHIYEINEDIPSEINNLNAFRINPYFFFSSNNGRINEIIQHRKKQNINISENIDDKYYFEKYNIDYNNLKMNVAGRKNDIVEFNENTNNINDDYLYFSLKYKDNIGLNNVFYQRCILQTFKIKNTKTKNIDIDYVIYLEKNKKCSDIYFEIFKIYAFNIIVSNFHDKKKKVLQNLRDSNDIEEKNRTINNTFTHFFKNAYFNPSKLRLFDNFPEMPFILFLKNEKYNIIEVIPFSNNIIYDDILARFYNKIQDAKNKNDEIQFKKNNETTREINEKNKTLINYAAQLNKILLNNNQNNTEEINNNKNNNGYNGLPGGGPSNSKRRKNSEDENEESRNDSDSNSDSNSDNYNNNEDNENSEQDTENDNNPIIIDDLSSISNSNNGSKFSKMKDFEIDIENQFDDNINDMNFIKLTGKDEDIDNIVVLFDDNILNQIRRFPVIDLFDISEKINEKTIKEELSIDKCFAEFSKEEKLDKENLWKCPLCNENLQANKKIELYNLPKILIIHLKRFNNNRKINTLINFPLENLSLDNYINKINKENNKYDLFGVINHIGTLSYGHYTAFCKNYHDNNWYQYDDRIVKRIENDNLKDIIVNQNAYVLFYREHKNDFINWENIYNKQYESINENNLKQYGDDFIYEKITYNDIINNKEKDEEDKIEEENKNENIDIKGNKSIDDNFKILENYDEIEKDDDNFSFKEGINNVIEEENKEDSNKINKSRMDEVQTPKFRNSIKNQIDIMTEEQKLDKKKIGVKLDYIEDNNLLIDKSLNKNKDYTNNNIDNNNNKYQTQVKEKHLNERMIIYKTLPKSKNNIIRITTYKRIRKKKNNLGSSTQRKKNEKNNNESQNKEASNINPLNETNNEINPSSLKKESDLLQYDIFNMSKNYFKINLNRECKPFKSVKSKELSNFILREYSDNVSDKVPRSKKLYEDSNINTENKSNKSIIINNKKNKEKLEEGRLVAIKEDDNESIKYMNKGDVDLEDYVYNPFRNCFAKTRKF